jgi:hypothetical protein
MSGKLLNTLYISNWKSQMKTFMSKARIFGLTIFGDGATIKTIPLINILAAGVNNSFALLDVVDCSNQASAGKKKDAKYIACLIHPFIEKLELECDGLSNNLTGAIDFVFLMGLPMSRMRARFLLPCTHISVLGMARSMLFHYFFQMSSKNVMNMPCFPSFLNPAATFGGQRHTSHRQCSNTTARFITMEFPLDLSSPLTVE